MFTSPLYADTGFTSTIRVSETDNSPACTVGQIKVTTGTLTCNGQVATISTGGSGGGGSSITTCGSNPTGIQLTDSASCTWCETVATAGNLVTTLIGCPAVTPHMICPAGQSRGLLLSLTCDGS